MADSVLHGKRSDGPVTGCDATGPVLVGNKEEKDGNKVPGNIMEVRLDAGGGAEAFPDAPGGGGGGAAMRRLGGMERCRDSVPITAENIAGSGRVCNGDKVSCW